MPEPVPAPGAALSSPRSDADGRRELAIAFGVGLGGTLLTLGRVWGGPGRRLLGDWQQAEVLGYQWVAEWVARRLLGFGGFLHTSASFAPVGETPLATLGGASPLISAPFLALLGWPLGINVYISLVCAANVAAGAFLGRVLGAGRPAALLGGLAFGLSPYLLGEVSAGRLGQVPAWALVAATGLWILQLEAPTRRRGVVTAAFFGLATLEYAWYGALGAIVALVLGVGALVRDPARPRDGAWTREIALTIGAALAFALPGLAIVLTGSPTAAEPRVPQPLAIEYSLPPLWPLGVDGGPEVPAALSFLVVGLAAVALLRASGPRAWVLRPLVAVAVVGWVLSLGPRMLTAGGPVVDSHFPFYWLYSTLLPGFLYPYQHVLLVTLALAPLAARGLSELATLLPARAEPALAALLALAVPAELYARGVALQPRVSHLAEEPAWIAELKALPEGAVAGLPLAPEMRVTQEALLLQMRHNHPIVDGRAMWRDDQRPAAWDAMIDESGFLKELVRFERGREIAGDAARANYFRYPVEDVQRLVDHGVRWVMVWDALYPESLKGLARAERKLLEQLCGKPALAAEGITVYDLGAHRGSGDLVAPVWRMPEGVRTGDGVRRMVGRFPPGVLFERGE